MWRISLQVFSATHFFHLFHNYFPFYHYYYQKKLKPKEGDIVVANIDNEFTLKYLQQEDGKMCLVPANAKYSKIYPKDSLTIEGVVVSSMRKYR